MTPRQFGPMTRIPLARASVTSSRCAASPSGPVSAKPLDTTTRPRTPFWVHCSTTSRTVLAGVATTARSTSSGMSSTVA